ncbi:hypothetical protein GP486_004045 [Trichoglossum hirsutum]|uniref:G domain-containing protein n=1 Tax=Trichoglossum hirsutum TaxID=265104 RepID=A0A9P8RPT2_9PEZI|nr:hypothetical protein GP486_004045 [Trichoglossum hirsutum]
MARVYEIEELLGSAPPPYESILPRTTVDARRPREIEHRNAETLSQEDVVVAVMGVTGAGKSSFISLLTDEPITVGHDLESCTSGIGVYSFVQSGGQTVYLIDTPGFNDTNRSDIEILKEIAFFFGGLYGKRVKLAGIVYLHRISDVRMTGTAFKNLQMLKKLCGDGFLPRVVLATTMWSLLANHGHEVGVEREQMLRSKFWSSMEQKGSRVLRHTDDEQSARSIVSYLLEKDTPAVLDIQREMVDSRLTLDETTAGRFLQEELLEAREKYQKEIAEYKESLQEARKDKDEESIAAISQQMREYESQTNRVDPDRAGFRMSLPEIIQERRREYASTDIGQERDDITRDEEIRFIHQTLADLQEQLEQKEREHRDAISRLRRNTQARVTEERDRAIFEQQQTWEMQRRELEARIYAEKQARLSREKRIEAMRKPKIIDIISSWILGLGMQYTGDRHVVEYMERNYPSRSRTH